nr:conjugative transposon protein TraM [uncultured Mucilaginibacter sp.]
MQINLKQPKYILPLILLPFLCLLFFVYRTGFGTEKTDKKPKDGINTTVGEVSGEVQKRQLEDKLDAYRNIYKEADGMTAVSPLPAEKTSNPSYNTGYSGKEQKMLDSINQVMKAKYGQGPVDLPTRKIRDPANNDQPLVAALNGLKNRRTVESVRSDAQQQVKDPMETFRQQMAYLDSINKANDPEAKAERKKADDLAKTAALKANEPKLAVRLADINSGDFNTIMPEKKPDFIKVVIDESLTGYAGSRIRLRLLDDILAGKNRIAKGTYIYALISGFSGQRVELSVQSILYQNKILPVKLEVYDLDGMAGLFVPESAFRDFTRELGTNTVQGVTIDGSGSGSAASQLAMSTASKLFQSTSSAIAGLIRKNKAKIKYNSYLYLIDHEALEKAQQNY